MLWLDHLRGNPEAFENFLAFLDAQQQEAFRHFLNAKDMTGMERVKGRVEAIDALKATVTHIERERRDATDRDARKHRAAAGIALGH